MHVPTNAELYENAPDNAWDAVRNWIARHPTPRDATLIGPANQSARTEWANWATANFFLDPEIRGAFQKEFGITWQV